MSRIRPKWVPLVGALVGMGLFLSLCLPWFRIPLLSWEIPLPACNKAGMAGAIVCGLSFFRLLVGPLGRWLVRLSLIPAAVTWWQSLAELKKWGAHYLGRAQLELAPVNRAIAAVGTDTIDLYRAQAWRTLEPQYGWYLAGGCLALSAVVSFLDGPVKRACSSCQTRLFEGDNFCHKCGDALAAKPVCSSCGRMATVGDSFCRCCGTKRED